MNTNEPLRPWDQLVARAQGDAPPATDLDGVLRAVRQEPLTGAETWLGAFGSLFANPRGLATCLAGAAAALAVLAWQLQDLFQSAPWAALLSIGGEA